MEAKLVPAHLDIASLGCDWRSFQMAKKIGVRRTRKFWLILALSLMLLVGAPVWCVVWVFSGHVYNPGDETTRADVTHYTSVPPPPEAKDFRVASFQEGTGVINLIRFTAPVDVCRKYAAAVVPNAALGSLSWDQRYMDVGTLYSASLRIHDLRWFDLPYAQGFWTVQSGEPVFRNPSAQANPPKTPDADPPQASEIMGAEASDEQAHQKGFESVSVRVDMKRGVFYLLQVN
jgi:hypothetical protein